MRIKLKTIPQINLSPIVFFLFFSFLSALPFRTYGYFDFEFELNNKDREGKIWTFDQHRLNIINIFSLDQNFRLFTEMEWEHGVYLEGGGKGSGKIYLTQGWLEYKKSNLFRLQMGKLLAPFGKYGLTYDASPTFLSTTLPSSVYGKHLNSVEVKDRLFAKLLTGIQIAGLVPLGDWGFEYFCYISNGRGPKPSEQDNNPNKGLGARFIVRSSLDNMVLGLSYYSDADGNSFNTIQTSFGADAEVSLQNFTLEFESIYKKGQMINTANNQLIDEYLTGYGYYFQTSYTIKDLWTPFLRLDRYDPDSNGPIKHDETFTAGINVSITPRIYVKLDVQDIRDDDHTSSYRSFLSSIAVAF